MKRRILERLRGAVGPISGEILSNELGVSRVSIWKHIQKLRGIGYEIESGGRGYRLAVSPDDPLPYEFPGREDRIHFFREVVSTMDTAREMARNDHPGFTVVVAKRQTRGRGRLQRQWGSDEGGLYFTIVLRPGIPPMLAFRVNFVASLSLTHILRALYGVHAQVKWPNDILVEEKKLVGILSEMETASDMVSFINIGVGVNINNDPRPHNPDATSLRLLLGKAVSPKALLAAFLDDFEARMATVDYDTVIEVWKAYTLTIGRRVRIVTTTETYEGKALDVAPDGALVLESADGTTKRVIYGDCFLRNGPESG